jgi:branched-chain amino acid transport system ATP-binding protein
MLDVSDLVTAYGKIEALKGVSLQIESGKITCLLGPNGAGKTTLMMTVAGILQPRRGSIRLAGAELSGLSPARIVSQGVALVPENRLVFPQMSVHENLLAGAYQRHDKPAINADIERMFTRFPRLHERREQPAGTLSGGEQQMLALGRAMMSEPHLICLDEPSLGLAPMVVQDIFRTIKAINAAGTSVLLVEQNARYALETASRGYVLQTGSIIAHGPCATLRNDDRVRQAYLGRSAAEQVKL